MQLAELIATTTPPAALLALAREIATFLPALARRAPTPHEEALLTTARLYAHAAGHFGVSGVRALLQAVDALDLERLQAAALLDRVWAGVPVRGDAEPADEEATALIDAAMERGLRLAQPPAAWWQRVY